MSIVKQITQMVIEFNTVFGVEPTKVVMSEETLDDLKAEVDPTQHIYKFSTIGKDKIMDLEIEIVKHATYMVVK